jgi:hypothetical protein
MFCLKNFEPYKILNKGSQSIIILTKNDKFVVKIYDTYSKNINEVMKIIFYLQNVTLLPKTIYKSYFITRRKNSLKRYLSNNSFPEHFSYYSENNLKELSKKYEMKIHIFEIMEKYEMTLSDFIKLLFTNSKPNNSLKKYNLLTSLFYQGILTLLWLFMKKSIIHFDINSTNFLIKSTKNKKFKITINDIVY